MIPRLGRVAWDSEVELVGRPGRLAATGDAELDQYPRHVMLDRLVGHEKLRGNLAVGQAIDYELQDLDLPGGEARWVGPRAGSYAAGHPLAQRSQTFGSECRGGSGA